MATEIHILENKLYIFEKLNKIYKGRYEKKIKEIEKIIEEYKKADKEIWE